MNENARILANLIAGLRAQAGLASLTPVGTHIGVAQWHANDMGANDYVGLVATDGEDPFVRFTCSGGGNINAVVLAVGYSTDPNAVFDALQSNSASRAVLLYDNFFASTNYGIGYSNGYWMIFREI